MPRPRPVRRTPDVPECPGPLSGRVLAAIAAAGFGAARITGPSSWEARCLLCTGENSVGTSAGHEHHGQRVATCSSVQACRLHQRRLHSSITHVVVDTRDPDAPFDMGPPLPGLDSPAAPGPAVSPSASADDGSEAGIDSPDEIRDRAHASPTASASPAVSVSMESDTAACSASTASTDGSDAPLVGARPRKGSAAWWFLHRLQPVAKGSNMSALQVAFSIAELRDKGVTKDASNSVARLLLHLLQSFTGPGFAMEDTHVPRSIHLVERVLGVREPHEFEFGWCPTCGHRYPQSDHPRLQPRHELSRLLQETCPHCGTPKYKVHLELPESSPDPLCTCVVYPLRKH